MREHLGGPSPSRITGACLRARAHPLLAKPKPRLSLHPGWRRSFEGWPKFVQSVFFVERGGARRRHASDGGRFSGPTDAVVVASLVPASAVLPASVAGSTGGTIETSSLYPFGDTATITVSGISTAVTVKVRVPGWATNATVNGKSATNGTLVAVECCAVERPGAAGDRTKTAVPRSLRSPAHVCGESCDISVALNPEVRIERGWGFVPNSTDSAAATNGASIVRGPLVFSLHPRENRTVVKNYSLDLPLRSRFLLYTFNCATYRCV